MLYRTITIRGGQKDEKDDKDEKSTDQLYLQTALDNCSYTVRINFTYLLSKMMLHANYTYLLTY